MIAGDARGGHRICAVTVAPPYGASSGEHRRSWSVWPQAVELSHEVLGMREVAEYEHDGVPLVVVAYVG